MPVDLEAVYAMVHVCSVETQQTDYLGRLGRPVPGDAEPEHDERFFGAQIQKIGPNIDRTWNLILGRMTFDGQRRRTEQGLHATGKIYGHRSIRVETVINGVGMKLLAKIQLPGFKQMDATRKMLTQSSMRIVNVQELVKVHDDHLVAGRYSDRPWQWDHDLRLGIEPLRKPNRQLRPGQGATEHPKRVVVGDKSQVTFNRKAKRTTTTSSVLEFPRVRFLYHQVRVLQRFVKEKSVSIVPIPASTDPTPPARSPVEPFSLA
jgi:hypothetical protein